VNLQGTDLCDKRAGIVQQVYGGAEPLAEGGQAQWDRACGSVHGEVYSEPDLPAGAGLPSRRGV